MYTQHVLSQVSFEPCIISTNIAEEFRDSTTVEFRVFLQRRQIAVALAAVVALVLRPVLAPDVILILGDEFAAELAVATLVDDPALFQLVPPAVDEVVKFLAASTACLDSVLPLYVGQEVALLLGPVVALVALELRLDVALEVDVVVRRARLGVLLLAAHADEVDGATAAIAIGPHVGLQVAVVGHRVVARVAVQLDFSD